MPVVTVPTRDQEVLVISQDVTKIPEVMEMVTSEQDLSQSYEASSESIISVSYQSNHKKAIKFDQEAILYWCYFIEKYDKRIDNLVADGVKKKTATSMVYQKIKQLLPDIT
ncbi:15730_t:CDS:2, partial [Funneliformis geosporum]